MTAPKPMPARTLKALKQIIEAEDMDEVRALARTELRFLKSLLPEKARK